VDLESAAEELYGVPADEFAEHRTRLAAQAKASGDKALAASIGKLRKPVLAAALVNELVRGEPAELRELTDLGEQMRSAHRHLRGPELRALSEQRQQLLQRLAELVRDSAEQSGRTVTEPVLAQVRGTFEAAIADEAAEAAVLSGRLTTVLSYTGFGEVDVTDAVAAPVRKRHLTSVPAGAGAGEKAPALAHERRRQRHQDQLRRAEAEQAEAARALDQARGEAAAAEQQHHEATGRVERLRVELGEAQEQAWRAGQVSRSADRVLRTAEQEADRTASAAQAVRDQLDDLKPD
jgi:chromosome segregation ATPase